MNFFILSVFHWILLIGFSIFFISALFLIFQVFHRKGVFDPSPLKGNIKKAIIYSFVGAMLPTKKESAILHLPTYIAGIVYHLGIFFSFFWLILLFFDIQTKDWFQSVSAYFLFVSSLFGLSLLIKRMTLSYMRSFSNRDDYFSNLLASGFQIFIALSLIINDLIPYLFVYSAILFIYIPLSKLRHSIYFFTTRIHLGIFYGRRGVWPVQKNKLNG